MRATLSRPHWGRLSLWPDCSRSAPEPDTLTLLDQQWTNRQLQDVRKLELEDSKRQTGIVGRR